MKFSEKLKKLRKDNNLTQDQLASKLYVTRTAISKWETDKGYPNIESLKLIANTFHMTLDQLISDEDIENKRLLEEQVARKCYYVALASFIVTLIFALVSYLTDIPYFLIPSFIGVISYAIFAFLSTPKYKRARAKNDNLTKYIITKVIVFAILLLAIITTAWQVF